MMDLATASKHPARLGFRLMGFIEPPSGRDLVFAILSADAARREAPAGEKPWAGLIVRGWCEALTRERVEFSFGISWLNVAIYLILKSCAGVFGQIEWR